MADEFTDWNDAPPFIESNKQVSNCMEFVAAGGSTLEAMVELDRFQVQANQGLVIALNHWKEDWGDPDIFVVSHWQGMRVIRWARARMFFRAVLNWEPPEEKLPSYERPMVKSNIYEMAIWN